MLSVVITAWNEAQNLPRVVKSVQKLADEIIVVDTESTDDTVSVATKLGCIVFHHKNTGIVEPVRNFSISKATGDWILLLDADEEVSKTLASEISAVISSNQADYFRIPRKNVIFGKMISNSHWWPDYVYRLFKKGSVVWSDVIHSIPTTRGRGADFAATEELAILHYHYDSITQYLDRLNRYTDHQLKYLHSQKIQFNWSDLISKPSQEFIRQFFARKGYQDGVHGLALASLQAVSELTLYLKLWQSTGFKKSAITLSQFNSVSSSEFKQLRWWLYEQGGVVGKILRKIKMLFV